MGRTKEAYLSLGSNLGDRHANLQEALRALVAEGIAVLACSSIYETEPQDVVGQPWFLNMVAKCGTNCFPVQLLSALQRIERELGRRRIGVAPRGPRLIDIDILLYGRTTLTTHDLTIPHPRMLHRRFVLEPLVEIAPELRDPCDGRPYARTLEDVQGQIIRKVAAGNCAAATTGGES